MREGLVIGYYVIVVEKQSRSTESTYNRYSNVLSYILTLAWPRFSIHSVNGNLLVFVRYKV